MSADEAHDERCVEERDLLKGFEQIDTPEGYRAEFIEGEIVVSPPPGGSHENNFARITFQVSRHASVPMDISGHKGLALVGGSHCTRNHLIPDMVVAPAEERLFVGAPSWMPPDGVLMVVEITSRRADIDRGVKRHCYAKNDIPLYLLVDRYERTITLFSEPDPGGEDYSADVRLPWGKSLELPDPFGFELDTSDFV